MHLIKYLSRGSNKSVSPELKTKEKIARERLQRIRTMREEFIQSRPDVYKEKQAVTQNQE